MGFVGQMGEGLTPTEGEKNTPREAKFLGLRPGGNKSQRNRVILQEELINLSKGELANGGVSSHMEGVPHQSKTEMDLGISRGMATIFEGGSKEVGAIDNETHAYERPCSGRPFRGRFVVPTS